MLPKKLSHLQFDLIFYKDNNMSKVQKAPHIRLYNRLNRDELKELLYAETFTRTTVSFYKYFNIENPQEFRDTMYSKFFELGVFGRIYVAQEGINAQISVPEHNFESFKEYLYSIPELNNLRLNIAVDDDGKSFWVLKVKVRNKIVADGIDDPEFNPANTGNYLSATAVNDLYSKNKDLIIVDMRNHYEYEIGHFENALEVPSETFREQLDMAVDMLQDKKDAEVIMYCTGGIRCEKATAWMKYNGFKKVYHVEGGIIHYANQVKQQGLENKFIGKNFVFDNRLSEEVDDTVLSKCHQCGDTCDAHTNCVNNGCHLLFIQCEACKQLFDGCCSEECQQIIHLSEDEQKIIRQGIKTGSKVFNKSKAKLKPHSKDARSNKSL